MILQTEVKKSLRALAKRDKAVAALNARQSARRPKTRPPSLASSPLQRPSPASPQGEPSAGHMCRLTATRCIKALEHLPIEIKRSFFTVANGCAVVRLHTMTGSRPKCTGRRPGPTAF